MRYCPSKNHAILAQLTLVDRPARRLITPHPPHCLLVLIALIGWDQTQQYLRVLFGMGLHLLSLSVTVFYEVLLSFSGIAEAGTAGIRAEAMAVSVHTPCTNPLSIQA